MSRAVDVMGLAGAASLIGGVWALAGVAWAAILLGLMLLSPLGVSTWRAGRPRNP